MRGWIVDEPFEGAVLCEGESPREHPWKQRGLLLTKDPFTGEWARYVDGYWRYTGIVFRVLPRELPEFL